MQTLTKVHQSLKQLCKPLTFSLWHTQHLLSSPNPLCVFASGYINMTELFLFLKTIYLAGTGPAIATTDPFCSDPICHEDYMFVLTSSSDLHALVFSNYITSCWEEKPFGLKYCGKCACCISRSQKCRFFCLFFGCMCKCMCLCTSCHTNVQKCNKEWHRLPPLPFTSLCRTATSSFSYLWHSLIV